MNILKRNKEIVQRHDAGEKMVALAEEYGLSVRTISVTYYDFENIINRPFYDIVAGMNFSDQIATKLVNALCWYEAAKGIDLDADYLKIMDRQELAKQRGVGRAVMDAFDKLQEAVRK